MKKRVVFLDLEATLIPVWGTWTLESDILPRIIRQCTQGPDEVLTLGLMSWAVWDRKDADTFMHHLHPLLEETLGRPFTHVFTMDMWASIMMQTCNLALSRDDMFDVMRKEDILFRLARSGWMFQHDIELIDDSVSPGLVVHIPEHQSSITFINPWDRPHE